MLGTKEKIHKAIWTIICDGTSSSLKVADIAKRAGIGKSTVYEYFTDKDQAVFSAITSYCENIVAKYDEVDISNLDFDTAFDGMCINMMEIASDYGENLMSAFTRLSSLNIKSTRKVIFHIQEKYLQNVLIIIKKGKQEKK